MTIPYLLIARDQFLHAQYYICCDVNVDVDSDQCDVNVVGNGAIDDDSNDVEKMQ